SLSYNNISSDDVTIIVDALQSNTKLNSIDLSHNSIRQNGAFIFANFFQQPHPSLKYINLIDNDIDEESQQIILSQCENLIHIIFSSENEPIIIQKQLFINERLSEN